MTLSSGVQGYIAIYAFAEALAFECLGCGAMVLDRNKHDYWHSKTRSVV